MPTLSEVYAMGDELTAHLAWLRAGGRTPHTVKSRASILGRFAAYLEPRTILEATEDDCVIWLNNPEWALATRRTYHANLAAYYEWAIRRDHITRSPMRNLPKPRGESRPPRDVPQDDFVRAYAGARPRTRVWLTLARYAGLRALEVAALQPEDIDFERGTLLVHGKGRKVAAVPMHPYVADELRGWLDTHDGQTWLATADDVSQAGNYALHNASARGTYHGLRHAFAMHLYDQYRDLALVSRALRHSSPAVTATYAQTRDDQLAEAVRNMGMEAS